MNIAKTTATNVDLVSTALPGQIARLPSGTSTLNGSASSNGVPDPFRTASRQDTLELSAKGLRLSQTQGADDAPPPEPPPPPPRETIPEGEQTALLGKESNWESERKAKLDRLETLVRQGQYKVDPFILDELAVRMARLMS